MLTIFFLSLKGLTSEVDWIRNGIVLACSVAHWRSFSTIIRSLFKWYTELKTKKMKSKNGRVEVSRIFRFKTIKI